MGYQDKWNLLEAEDELDEMEHRQPTEEFLFYQPYPAAMWKQLKITADRNGFWTAME